MSEKLKSPPENAPDDLGAVLKRRARVDAILNHKDFVWGTTDYGPCVVSREPRGYRVELKGPGPHVETDLKISSKGTVENLGSKKQSYLETSHGKSHLTREERLPSAKIDIDELLKSFRETSPITPKKSTGDQTQMR